MTLTPDQQQFHDQIRTVSIPMAIWVHAELTKGRTLDSVKRQIARCVAVVGPVRDEGKFLVFTPVEVTMEMISNAIVGVFENGYSPWVHSVESLTEYESNGTIWYAREDYWRDGGRMRVTYEDPNFVEDSEKNASMEIGLPEILAGIEKMAIHQRDHFNDLVNENDDAITHDVLFQFVVLGEIVYG